MASRVQRLEQKKLITPPKWLSNNIMYETIMGSYAYGVSSDTSDMDLYGFAMPPKDVIFPHTAGHIEGFGTNKPSFDQFLCDHVEDKEERKQYDCSIFNITKYFTLLTQNNPNMIDSLFTPDFCVQHITKVGTMVRERRREFLHKGSWHKFKGYAFGQQHKMEIKEVKVDFLVKFEQEHGILRETTFANAETELRDRNKGLKAFHQYKELDDSVIEEYVRLYRQGMESSKRFEGIKIHGMDVKFAYHVVRLLDEAEQILTTGDIDLQRNREQLKAIRRGEMSKDEIKAWFTERENSLQKLYETSNVVPHSPDEGKIRQLLADCIEEHYGSLDKFGYVNPDAATNALREITAVIDKYRATLEKQ